jgi:hypothetical protein
MITAVVVIEIETGIGIETVNATAIVIVTVIVIVTETEKETASVKGIENVMIASAKETELVRMSGLYRSPSEKSQPQALYFRKNRFAKRK